MHVGAWRERVEGGKRVCDGTVVRQVGEVPQGAADSQTPADSKQCATAGQECAAGRTTELHVFCACLRGEGLCETLLRAERESFVLV